MARASGKETPENYRTLNITSLKRETLLAPGAPLLVL
jgi:hypothetical protein